jgi:hypothetical protein
VGRAGEPRFEQAVAIAAATAIGAQNDGIEVVHAIESNGHGRIEWLTPRTLLRAFAHIGYLPVPGPLTVQLLLDAIGTGGVLMLEVGADMSTGLSAYVYDAAAESGVRVLDLAEQGRVSE